MSDAYLSALLAVAVVGGVARYALAALPLRRYVARLTVVDVIAVAVGSVGLLLHCGAMFFRTTVAAWPGGPAVIRVVDPMGTASITWYAVAAALVVLGLRRLQPVVVATVAASLAEVGFTMYDGGPLRTHLDVIAATVVVFVGALAACADPPWRHPRTESAAPA